MIGFIEIQQKNGMRITIATSQIISVEEIDPGSDATQAATRILFVGNKIVLTHEIYEDIRHKIKQAQPQE